MKSFNDLLIELGFNSSASIGSQQAFVRHLLKASETRLNEMKPILPVAVTESETSISEQLSFDPDVLNAK